MELLEKREELYKAYTTRAPQNGKIIEKILALKDEKVKILGFKNLCFIFIGYKNGK